jgi:hypothetical protein
MVGEQLRPREAVTQVPRHEKYFVAEPKRWKEFEQLVDRALDLGPQERPAFLDRACAGDPALRAEVERLLREAEAPGSFLEEPAAKYAAR